MWAVYKYSLKRIVNKPSTYVIGGISILITLLTISSIAPMGGGITLWAYIFNLFYTFTFAVLLPIFTGTKATIPIRLEIEEGTFLTIISKPISRTNIVIAKWLALLTTVWAFIFFVQISSLGILLMLNQDGSITSAASVPLMFSVFFKMLLFSVLVYTVIATLLLLLSLKVGTKLLVTLGLVFGISLLAAPPIIQSTAIVEYGELPKAVVLDPSNNEAEAVALEWYRTQIDDHKVYHFIKWIDVTYHFESMYTNFVGKNAMDQVAADILDKGTEMELGETGGPGYRNNYTYKITKNSDGTYTVKAVDFMNPYLLIVMYLLLFAGAIALGIRSLIRRDFS